MMDEVTLANESYQLIRSDFGLEETEEVAMVEIAFDWLEGYLEKQVSYLLDNDFNRLLNALYRIDIADSKTKELLELSESEEIALNISKAIIEREKEKVLTREQYRQQQ